MLIRSSILPNLLQICLESALDEKIWDYEDQCQIKWLPSEIFDIIFSRLDVKSLMRLSLTCKKIFVLGTAEEKWQRKFLGYRGP